MLLELHLFSVPKISPHRLGIPQQRHRLYVVAIDDALADSDTIDRVVALCRQTQSKTDTEMIQLDTFLLKEGHEVIKTQLDLTCEKKFLVVSRGTKRKGRIQGDGHCDGAGVEQWKANQLTLVTKKMSVLKGTMWDANNELGDDLMCAASPWYATLTEREKLILRSLESNMANARSITRGGGFVADLSQSLERQSHNTNPAYINCLTPGARLWHMDRNRAILACERLALQGILVKRDTLLAFSNQLGNDLAGNAYNGPCFCVVFICLFAALSESPAFRSEVGLDCAQPH